VAEQQKILLVAGDIVMCPHCKRAFHGTVENFSNRGKLGDESYVVTECYWCEENFGVKEEEEGFFVLQKV
jgi:hypothetical protein